MRTPVPLSVLVAAMVLPALAVPAPAQVSLHDLNSVPPAGSILFGNALANWGDLDGDGWADVLVGASNETWLGKDSAGAVYAFSGRTGALLWKQGGNMVSEAFGTDVDFVGDVNGDGKDDVVVGAVAAFLTAGTNPKGAVYLLNGADGAQICTRSGDLPNDWLGFSVSDAGDVNPDGTPDFMAGALFGDNGAGTPTGWVRVYSGVDCSTIYQLTGGALLEDFGSSVDRIRDLDSDGVDDLLIGATEGHQPIGSNGPGYVLVVSGATGSTIGTLVGGANGETFGRSVADAGDVDGDGLNDIIVGCNEESTGKTGYAKVYDGETFMQLGPIFTGKAPLDEFGSVVAGIGDYDCDGQADVAVSSPFHDTMTLTNAGSVTVYSVLTGTVLFEVVGKASNDGVQDLAGGGDVNCDGYPDLVVGAPSVGGNHGAAWVYLGLPSGCSNTTASLDDDADGIPNDCEEWVDLGAGLAGWTDKTPVLTGDGFLDADKPVRLVLTDARPLADAWLILGISALNLPFKGGTMVPHPDVLFGPLNLPLTGGVTLESSWPASIPDGFELWVQFWIVDDSGPNGWAASNALMGTS